MSSIQGKREKDGKRGEIYRRRFFFGSAYWFFIKNRSFARRRKGMRCFRLSSLCHKICCCYRSASFLNQYSTTTRDFLFLTFTFEINGFISFFQHAAELLNETWKKIPWESSALSEFCFEFTSERKPFAIILVFAHSDLLWPWAILWPHRGKASRERHIKY